MFGNNGSDTPSLSLGRRIRSPYTLLSFAAAIALIVFLATRFDLDVGQMWAKIREMDPALYVLALLLYYLSFVFRGIRWRILSRSAGLEDIPNAQMLSVPHFSLLIIVGWFGNSVVGGRVGDAYRAYTLSNDARTGFSWSLGTIFAERIMDMVAVFLMIVVGALWFSLTADFEGTFYIVIVSFAFALALLVVLVVMRGYGPRLARFLPNRLESAYEKFHEGTVGSFGELRVPFILSLIGWILEVARLYFVVQALGFEIPLSLVLVAALGHALLSTFPTPGGIGAVETGLTGLLGLGGLDRSDAASIVLVDRSITYLSIIVFGGLIFLVWNLTKTRRRERNVGMAEASAD